MLPAIEETIKKFGKGLGSKYTLKFRGDVDVLYNDIEDEGNGNEEELGLP